MDPRPNQQHASLQLTVFQQKLTRPKARFIFSPGCGSNPPLLQWKVLIKLIYSAHILQFLFVVIRSVEKSKAKKLCDDKGIKLFETSAATGFNVDDAFMTIVRKIRRKFDPKESKSSSLKHNLNLTASNPPPPPQNSLTVGYIVLWRPKKRHTKTSGQSFV